MNITDSAFIAAGISGAAVFWGQARGVLSRIVSVAIVSIDLQGSSEDALVAYCWKNFKCSRFGDRRFTGSTRFIKPKSRQGNVGFEMTGKHLTFWRGWRPLFVAASVAKDGDFDGNGTKLTFLRGTFDIDKLLAEAIDDFDEYRHGKKVESSRFHVRKVFGKAAKSKDDDRGQVSPSSSKSDRDSNADPSLRPLRWKNDELGQPTSKAPFDNLAYNKAVEEFEKEIKRWFKSEQWFKDRGLPWRFGGGLYGPPGTGKSSFIRAIAQDLDMPVHVYDLTTMSNEELTRFWDDSLGCAPCTVVFEDIDRIFDKDKNIKHTNTNKSALTFDCLLNCIQGVQMADGILVLVTANDVSKVDPALGVPDEKDPTMSTRPGRLDRTVHFGILDQDNRIKIANRILAGFESFIPEVVKSGEGESGAQFESRCAKLALEQYWLGKESK